MNLSEENPLSEKERQYIANIPLIPPKKAFQMIQKKGYRGQKLARKSICLAAYRHVKRIKQIHLERVKREQLPPKSNLLLVGPTGCGKTFLVELLFQSILRLPTIIVDITGFSETGYIGEDTKHILTRLLLAAEGNPLLASLGVICLDEFDKLASNQSTSPHEGQGNKDVSGYGVQRELLRMLESAEMEIPTDFENSLYSTKQKIYTGDITFIACGAFSHLKSQIFERQKTPKIGFQDYESQEIHSNIAYLLTENEVNDIANFSHYGFIPELMARFTRVVPMHPLDKETLKSILIDNVVKKFQVEFRSEELDLEVSEEVLDHIVEKSYERQTGARGLGSLLTQHLEEAAFEHFCGRPGKVQLELLQQERIVAKKIEAQKKFSHK